MRGVERERERFHCYPPNKELYLSLEDISQLPPIESLQPYHHSIPHHSSTPHHITSHHITSHHITSHHIAPHYITSHHITAHHITSHHITSHHTTAHHNTSHHSTVHHTTSQYVPEYCSLHRAGMAVGPSLQQPFTSTVKCTPRNGADRSGTCTKKRGERREEVDGERRELREEEKGKRRGRRRREEGEEGRRLSKDENSTQQVDTEETIESKHPQDICLCLEREFADCTACKDP